MHSILPISRTRVRAAYLFTFTILLFLINAAAQGTLRGIVKDPLGAVVAHARVELLNGTSIAATATTNQTGEYSLPVRAAALYRVRAAAPTFQTTTSQPIFANSSTQADIDIILATGTLTQQVTVTATGTPTPIAQIGAPVTVLTSDDFRYTPQVADPLRLVPGLQLTQSGQAGGTTALYIRGGNSNANKVLIDGVPANDTGGAVEFANLATVGVQQIEVLRQPNSALYGSDALAGVVSLTTTRGTTRLPLFTYSGDAGNFGTYRQDVAVRGLFRQFDYLSEFVRMDTRNNLPRDQFHNATYVGNFGWTPNTVNSLRFTVRHLAVAAGQPNTIDLYGIADDAGYKEQESYYSAAWDNQTNRWHNQIRYGGLRLNYQYTDYAPTGIYDPNTDLYLGAPVTITGANGYSVTGQAIFQYGTSYGSTYPNTYVAPGKRDFVYAQTDYQFNPHLVALGGFKYEDERGYTLSQGGTPNSIERGNYSYTVQLGGALSDRLYYTVGSGLEDNGLFGFAATPRASLAYYLVRPSAAQWLSGTKLHFSFGKGIKEPNIFNQDSSLYGLLSALPNGAALIEQYHVLPIGPETSRSFDGGIDQQLWNGRARIGLTYFHNQFTNGVEYVPHSALVYLGFAAAGNPAAQYGATINSLAFRAQGAEAEIEYQISHHLFARGGYTYLDAVVQRSFSSSSAPVYNTSSNFSTIPIGQYSPLVGARPFRRAPHTGFFALDYMRSRWYGSLTGTLVGRRDDSTYLSDENFGPSLLLPNRNLLGAYQRLDLSGGYEVSHRLTAYANIQNLLGEHYSEAFGYPALPLAFRAGLKFSFGGESWSIR